MALSCLHVCAATIAVILLSGVAEGCSDKHQKCFQWAMAGECMNNPGYMMVHCAESCDQCVVQDEACRDLNEQCAAWANNDECKKNYPYMRATCARACTFCVPANDHSVPHVRANVVDSHWDEYNSLHPDLPIKHHG